MSDRGDAGPEPAWLDELRAMPQRSAMLPIACVEGWSANRYWTGVSMPALLASAGVTDADYIRSSGVAGRLSAQMGISEDEAVVGLQQAMGLMATQAGASPAQPKKPAAKKTTARKATADPSAPKPVKKSSRKTTKTTPKKSSTSDTGSDFMDLLDDPR